MAGARLVSDWNWPASWQAEARAALIPYVDEDTRVEIIVDDPASTIDGTVIAGFVYSDGKELRIIHDRSGRPDVYPWDLLSGPVLRIWALPPRRKRVLLYAHPDWTPHAD
jgi:hypothetical protein